jgi:hypothetical protein
MDGFLLWDELIRPADSAQGCKRGTVFCRSPAKKMSSRNALRNPRLLFLVPAPEKGEAVAKVMFGGDPLGTQVWTDRLPHKYESFSLAGCLLL